MGLLPTLFIQDSLDDLGVMDDLSSLAGTGGSDSVHYPGRELQRVSFTDPVEVSRVKAMLLIQQQQRASYRAEGRRKRKYPKKRKLVFPDPSGDHCNSWEEWKEWREQGWSTALNSFLTSLALRTLNDYEDLHPLDPDEEHDWEFYEAMAQNSSASLMDYDELVNVLFSACREAGYGDLTEESGPARLRASRMLERCEQQAAFALGVWTPDFMADLRARAIRGGENSKRPKIFTVEMLIPYLHLTRREQMKALGCSESTIKRLRREHKAVAESQKQHIETSDASGSEDFHEPSFRMADSTSYAGHSSRPPVRSVHVPCARRHRGRSRSRGGLFADFARRGERVAGFHSTPPARPRGSRCRKCSPRSRGTHTHDARRASPGGCRRGP
jgi:hypothetical protein